MTYPEPRYLREAGEASAVYRPTSTPPAPASMLIHFAPGAPREGYFEGLAGWAADGKPSAEEIEAFYRFHDNLFVG